jgi:hypothetical protein
MRRLFGIYLDRSIRFRSVVRVLNFGMSRRYRGAVETDSGTALIKGVLSYRVQHWRLERALRALLFLTEYVSIGHFYIQANFTQPPTLMSIVPQLSDKAIFLSVFYEQNRTSQSRQNLFSNFYASTTTSATCLQLHYAQRRVYAHHNRDRSVA